jgi:hypothetical protein
VHHAANPPPDEGSDPWREFQQLDAAFEDEHGVCSLTNFVQSVRQSKGLDTHELAMDIASIKIKLMLPILGLAVPHKQLGGTGAIGAYLLSPVALATALRAQLLVNCNKPLTSDPNQRLAAGCHPRYNDVFEKHLGTSLVLPFQLVDELLPPLEAAVSSRDACFSKSDKEKIAQLKLFSERLLPGELKN